MSRGPGDGRKARSCSFSWSPAGPSCGSNQHGQQAAALLGSTMTEEQEKCLAPFITITVAMDNDEPGRAAAEKIVARLRPRHKVLRAYLVD